MLVRFAIYLLATIFAFQGGKHLGEMSGPGRLAANDGTTASTMRQVSEPPPCPEVNEIIVEEPCPSDSQTLHPGQGPGKGIAKAYISNEQILNLFYFGIHYLIHSETTTQRAK